jgi:peptidyl-prolyl cis-trans isomerase C
MTERLVGVFLVGLSLLACRRHEGPPASPVAPASNVIATVDDHTITTTDLEASIAKQPAALRAQYRSPAKKKELLQNLIRFELMVRDAQRLGMDTDPEVERLMKQQMVNQLVQRRVDRGAKPADISDADAEAYYKEHAEQFSGGLEEVRVSQIVVKDRGRIQAVIAETRALGSKDERGFRELVKKYSDDPESKVKGGALPWLSRGGSGQAPALVNAAFALGEASSVSEAIETPQGFHVLKFWDRRRAGGRPFDAVKDEVKTRLHYERRAKRMEDWLSDLRKLSTVKVYDDRLSAVLVSLPDAGATAPAPP